jgi:predicted branched-subunit amino acid permease
MTATIGPDIRIATGVADDRRAVSLAIEGARDITPMVIGVIPFGLAIGASIASSSLSAAQGIASAPIILAGAAQISTIQMLDAGVAPLVIVLSALMINARILLYSASMAPWFSSESLGRRLLLAVPVIDQMHFTCVPRFEQFDLSARERRAYYAGAGTWLIAAWLGSQAIAITIGAAVPDAVGLRIAAPLAMAGLLAKSTVGRDTIVAAGVAAVVVTGGVGLPLHSSVLVAAIAGIAAGTMYHRRAS